MKKRFECDNCDAYGVIAHDLDAEYYEITTCPFCGSELNSSESDEDDE